MDTIRCGRRAAGSSQLYIRKRNDIMTLTHFGISCTFTSPCIKSYTFCATRCNLMANVSSFLLFILDGFLRSKLFSSKSEWEAKWLYYNGDLRAYMFLTVYISVVLLSCYCSRSSISLQVFIFLPIQNMLYHLILMRFFSISRRADFLECPPW